MTQYLFLIQSKGKIHFLKTKQKIISCKNDFLSHCLVADLTFYSDKYDKERERGVGVKWPYSWEPLCVKNI